MKITSVASTVFKFSCVQCFFFCIFRHVKNRPRSPILELDLDIHLVHNHGEYHRASFYGFQAMLTDGCKHERTDGQPENIMLPATSGRGINIAKGR